MASVNPARLIALKRLDGEVANVVIYAANGIMKATGEGLSSNAGPITRAIWDGLGGGVFPKSELLVANKEIAKRAQQAMLAGWRSRLPAKSAPYRRGSNPKKDRLSGTLGEALASPDMIGATTDRGISFINYTLLNSEARHWYRVNYGAFGPNATLRRPKAYPVTMGGHTLFALRDEAVPAPNSWLPRRFQITSDNVFTPLRGPGKFPGGGTRAALFTDLGFKAVADNIEPVYREMVFRYFRGGGLKQRYEMRGVHLRV